RLEREALIFLPQIFLPRSRVTTQASSVIRISDFVLVSDFDIRISNFSAVVLANKIDHPQILLLILQRHQLHSTSACFCSARSRYWPVLSRPSASASRTRAAG